LAQSKFNDTTNHNTMKILENHKGIVVAIILFAAVMLAYNYIAPSTSITAPDLVTQGAGAEVVSLYSSLQSITFDQSIFTSPSYEALTDFSTPLPTEAVGRSNPFDAL
jgi:hypothetical protein